jgi:site-specific recombinase XerC
MVFPSRRSFGQIASVLTKLGHESVETTQIYLDADLAIKEQALQKATPIDGKASAFDRTMNS